MIFTTFAFGQTLKVMELEWTKLNRNYGLQKETLARERARLDTLLARIDVQKGKPRRDESLLKKLMAEGLRKSDLLEKKYRELTRTETRLSRLRQQLYRQYSARIDSLSTVLPKADAQKHRILEKQLASLQTRRLYVSPWIPRISFNQQLIHAISLQKTDSTGKRIYRAYLKNTLEDVDSSLAVIGQKREELQSLLRLEQRSRDFQADIEDVYAFDDVYSGDLLERKGEAGAQGFVSDNAARSGNFVESAPFLFNIAQLNSFLLISNERENISIEADSLSTENYLRALTEGQKQLLQLRAEILARLKGN